MIFLRSRSLDNTLVMKGKRRLKQKAIIAQEKTQSVNSKVAAQECGEIVDS